MNLLADVSDMCRIAVSDRRHRVMASLTPPWRQYFVDLSKYMFVELGYPVWAKLSKGERDAHRDLADAHKIGMRGNLTENQYFQKVSETGDDRYRAPELRLERGSLSTIPTRGSPVALFLERTTNLICRFIGATELHLPLSQIDFGDPTSPGVPQRGNRGVARYCEDDSPEMLKEVFALGSPVLPRFVGRLRDLSRGCEDPDKEQRPVEPDRRQEKRNAAHGLW
jgi:hypothetical protein